ncbi:MAG: hypothetical protein AB7T27_06210 [Kiritimatiellia bacterium]
MIKRSWLIGAVLVCCAACAADADTPPAGPYYRVASTQITRIVSAQADGTLTWTNSEPSASCTLEWSFWLDGPWTESFDPVGIVTSGVSRTWLVDVPDAIPNDMLCIRNLLLIHQAKERLRLEHGFEYGFSVSFFDLLMVGLDISTLACPDEGSYMINDIGILPACSYSGGTWPHSLPDNVW